VATSRARVKKLIKKQFFSDVSTLGFLSWVNGTNKTLCVSSFVVSNVVDVLRGDTQTLHSAGTVKVYTLVEVSAQYLLQYHMSRIRTVKSLICT
jgi:hypothetical protein